MQQQPPQQTPTMSLFDSYVNSLHLRRQILRQDLLELKDILTKANLEEIEDRYMDASREMHEAVVTETDLKKKKYDDFVKDFA